MSCPRIPFAPAGHCADCAEHAAAEKAATIAWIEANMSGKKKANALVAVEATYA